MTSMDTEPELTCPLCGKPSVDGKEHQECMDRAAAEAELSETGPEVGEKPIPVYLLDEPPEGKVNFVKWALMHGSSEEELKADPNINERTVDICAQELEKDGHRARPPKPTKEEKRQLVTTGPAGKTLQTFAKGSPPEAIIEGMMIPLPDGEKERFESGMKFGASIVVLGVRIAQELSGIGVQQARPLVEMARDMRSGEAAAAKGAATEAAMGAAAMIQQNLAPYLANIGKPAETNPMQGMMVRTMEPIIQRMMGSIMPGMGPQQAPGWTRKQE